MGQERDTCEGEAVDAEKGCVTEGMNREGFIGLRLVQGHPVRLEEEVGNEVEDEQ